jgi:hypothetical protein
LIKISRNMELNIDVNRTIATREIQKIILKLELELKNEKISDQDRSNIKSDLINLNYMLKALDQMHVVESQRKAEIKFS